MKTGPSAKEPWVDDWNESFLGQQSNKEKVLLWCGSAMSPESTRKDMHLRTPQWADSSEAESHRIDCR